MKLKGITSLAFAILMALLLSVAPVFSADQTITAAEEMVGSGHATKTDTLNRHGLVGHNTDGTHKAGLGDLLNGAANLKAYMNAGATAPEWAAGVAIVSGTRDMTAESGDVSYTAFGFKPSAIIAFATISGQLTFSLGGGVGTTENAVGQYTTSAFSYDGGRLIAAYLTDSDNQLAADGKIAVTK